MAKPKTELERVQQEVDRQNAFINECLTSGSYDGPNGVAIRRADFNALREWQDRLEQVKRRQHKPGRVYPSRKKVVKPLFGTMAYITY